MFQHIIQKFGERKTARVSAYGTVADKGAIDDICRGLKTRWVTDNRKDLNPKTFKDEMIPECPFTLKAADKIKDEYMSNPTAARQKYPDVFYYFDGTVNTIVSQSIHAAGIVISPVTLDDNYGTFYNSGEHCLLLDMEEAHDVGMCKYDMLILTNVKIIADTYKALGKPFPKTHEIDFNDQAVWKDMRRSPYGIFQMESSLGYNSLRKMKPTSVKEMALLTASIRPSGASYRDDVFARKVHANPTKEMDELFKDNFGFCVYQEDILRALIELCGFSGSQADTVRRDIAKKNPEKVAKDIVLIKQGYIERSNKPREEAERDVADLLQVIQDASGYSFNSSHAVAYSIVGFMCAYCRHYHPLEFCTAYLNGAKSQEDIYHGTVLAQLYGINIQPPTFGHSGDEYTFDRATNTIYQGLDSVKDMESGVGQRMAELEKTAPTDSAVDLFRYLKSNGIGNKQLEILIDIGFFANFGNVRKLQKILENAIALKWGDMTWLAHEKLPRFSFEAGALSAYAERRTEKNWKVKDGAGLLRYMGRIVDDQNVQDEPLSEKFSKWMNYLGYIPAMGADFRAKMYVSTDPRELRSKKTGKVWAHCISAISLRTAEMHEWLIPSGFYINKLKKGDVIQVVGGREGFSVGDYNGMPTYRLYNYKVTNV